MLLDLPALPFVVTSLGEGDGEPAIVLPGGPCRDPEYLEDLAGVGADRPLVVLHPRGTPRSGGLSSGWWADAADVVELADALGRGAVDLVGHSAGTRLAVATAAQFRDRVRSMALVTPPATWLTGTLSDAAGGAVSRMEPAVRDALLALDADDPATEAEYRALFLRQAPASYAHWTRAERNHATVGAVSLAATTAWFNGIPTDAAERIRAMQSVPTLVIGGERDLLTGCSPSVTTRRSSAPT